MPRSIWNGALSFGLVNVPVQLFSSVEQKDIAFHEFQAGTGARIRHKRVSEKTGREVDYSDIEKGYETSKGKYVMLTREELESVEPGKSRTIDIEDFVELSEIDPIYFEKPYYLVPQKGAEKPYALLRAALEDSERVAIARFVMRTKQYLAAVRAADDMLVLETMHFPNEIRDTKGLNVPKRTKVPDKELRIAEQLIDSMTVAWKPERYEDTYRSRVLDLIRRKGKGQEIEVEKPEREESNVVDLVEALQRSLDAKAKGGRRARKSTTTKSTTEVDSHLDPETGPGGLITRRIRTCSKIGASWAVASRSPFRSAGSRSPSRTTSRPAKSRRCGTGHAISCSGATPPGHSTCRTRTARTSVRTSGSAARSTATRSSAPSTGGSTTGRARARTSRTASATTRRRSSAPTRRSSATDSSSPGTTPARKRRSGTSR